MADEKVEAAGLWLHGSRIGVFQRVGTAVRFSFLESYLGDPGRPTLSYSIGPDPVEEFRRPMDFPVWFENALPEGQLEGMVRRQIGGFNPGKFDLLVALGGDLPGAVEVRPENRGNTFLGSAPDSPGSRPVIDRDDDLIHFSLAGVGLKFSGVEIGSRFVSGTTENGRPRIIKMPDPNYPNLPRNECFVMDLAQSCGISVPDRRLVHIDQVGEEMTRFFLREEVAYSIARFDRAAESSEFKIHSEDFQQLRRKPPRDKYQGKQETLFNIVRRICGESDYREAIRRFVFNILVDNTDAHWKNWSVCYPDRITPQLSPAYDLVCVGLYNNRDLGFPGGIATDLALPFNGRKRASQIRRKDVERVGRLLGDADFADSVYGVASEMRGIIRRHEPDGEFESTVMSHIRDNALGQLSD